MKWTRSMVWRMSAGLLIWTGVASAQPESEASSATGPCSGQFPDLLADICWNCVFPISIGGATISNGEPDSGDSPPMICECPEPPPVFVRYGIGIGYWEPARVAEVVRTPYCSPTLGGEILSDQPATRGTHGDGGENQHDAAFYQVHWFTFPVLSWVSAALTSAMCDSGDTFDLVYVTELDALWDDDELAFLINPEAVLFANVAAQAACIADTLAATTGFGIDALFWCSGSQGSVYPLAGTNAHHIGAVDTSLLLTHRMAAKLHRQLIAKDTSTTGAMCGPVAQPILRKGQYKTQQLHPIARTQRGMPFGRPSAIWAAGHEYPYEGEDQTHLVWRKRLCCAF
jgi:conjugal transfer pilus assembly protein TraU